MVIGMDKDSILLEPYVKLTQKLHTINEVFWSVFGGATEAPAKELLLDKNYRSLATEVFGEAQIFALENIGEKDSQGDSLRRWVKNWEDYRGNSVMIDTCMGCTHAMPALHFVYALEGDAIITTEEADILLLQGQTAIFDIGFSHGVKAPEDSDPIIISIVMNKSYLAEMVGAKSHANPLFNEFLSRAFYPGDVHRDYIIFNSEEDVMLRGQFLLAVKEYTYNQPFSLDAVDAYIMQIMVLLMREYSLSFRNESGAPHLNERAKQILDYIDTNLCDVTLESTARAFHFSPNHLSRLLKEQTGSTFIDLVQKARLREATYYLRMQNLTVTQVANLVGYNNITYFYKLFESKFHVSPNEYRKKYGMFSEKYRTRLFQEDENQ